MAENDIYGNKEKYERFLKNLDVYDQKPAKNERRRKYWIKNQKNKEYLLQLDKVLDARDLSYIRRLRLLRTLLLISNLTEKDIKDCTREDIEEVMRGMHHFYKSVKSKRDFIADIKHIWRTLFPVIDEGGLVDEAQTPYAVRNLRNHADISREKRRQDKLTFEEFQRIVEFFGNNPRDQAFVMLSYESIGRPQEILFTRIKDVEINDNYAKVYVSEHGKEGIKFMQSIDSFPYLMRWLDKHPLKNDPNAFLFVNLEGNTRLKQLRPMTMNKKLKGACAALSIKKPLTCYSLKRNGITHRRLRGDSDVGIQHAAGWKSTAQLKVYDMSDQEDAFKMELAKRGMIASDEEKYKRLMPKTRECLFCNEKAAWTDITCPKCHRPMDREKIKELVAQTESLPQLYDKIKRLSDGLTALQVKFAEMEGKQVKVT